MTIEGKVAGIINERDLVINRGTEAGVSEGMKFSVMEPQVLVKDPDTGEELGSIDKDKLESRWLRCMKNSRSAKHTKHML